MLIFDLKIKNLVILTIIVATVFMCGCSQPVLESEECIASRDAVKKFYSLHLGNEMKPSEEYFEERKEYLSSELSDTIKSNLYSERDYFTSTDDYPKAFRVGACENAGKDKTKFEILLFWRRNETNTQRAIEVEAIKEKDKWLINKVSPK